jgi:hypothetical protein
MARRRFPGEQIPAGLAVGMRGARITAQTVIFVKNIVNCAIFYPCFGV